MDRGVTGELSIAGRSSEPEFIVVYHGSSKPGTTTENLKMYGPDPNREFYLTPSKSIASQAAGPNGRVLTYRVPKDLAQEILGDPKPYAGIFGEGEEFITEGAKSKELHKYLDPKDKIELY